MSANRFVDDGIGLIITDVDGEDRSLTLERQLGSLAFDLLPETGLHGQDTAEDND